jgi:membrane-associated phospholipid phosphatase
VFAIDFSDRTFLPFLFQHIAGTFVTFVLAWLATCALLVFLFFSSKPRLRERAIHIDTLLRARAHRVRFGSHEHEDAALRRERVLLTWFFRFWTNFASAPVLITASLVVPFVAFRHSMATGVFDRQFAAAWLLPGFCYSGSMLLSFVLKRIFRRKRPPLQKGDFGYKLIKDPSFPSGHSLTSLCFWAMVPFAAYFTGWPPNLVLALGVLAALIVALTGMSRIYLRVHFPSDVAGGYLIGTVWTSLCLMLLPGALQIR